MYYAYTGKMHLVSKKLHEQYGPVVRMAPNYLDVDYSSLIKTCFDVQGVWQKVRRDKIVKSGYMGLTPTDGVACRQWRHGRRQTVLQHLLRGAFC